MVGYKRSLACQGVAARTHLQPGFALARYAVAGSAAAQRSLVPQVRIELTTYPLPRDCATTTLLRQPVWYRTGKSGAGPITRSADAGKGA